MRMNRHGYEELIRGDIAWLDTVASDAQKRAPLEYAHIKLVLEWSVRALYDMRVIFQEQEVSAAEVEVLLAELRKAEQEMQSAPIVPSERTCWAGQSQLYVEPRGPDSVYVEYPEDEIVHCTCMREMGSEQRITDTCRLHNDRNGLLECCCIGLPLEPPAGTKCPRHPER